MTKLDELLEKATDARAEVLRREKGLGIDSEAGTPAAPASTTRTAPSASEGGSTP